ncbi:MAG: uroporphyrinogen decarboxylase family protein [Terriglobia bacterium]
MLQGTPEVVHQESAELISIAGQGGGFILSPGCEVPRDTPPRTCWRPSQQAHDFA